MPSSSQYGSPDQKAAFVMEYVGFSDRFKSQYVEMWLETLDNFTMGAGNLSDQRQSTLSSSAMDMIYLKDPETHQAIMTYAAKLIRSVFGDQRGEYIQAEPVGWEDAVGAAPTVS